MAKQKFYVVWKGRKAGIFNTWAECKALVDGFAGAKYKSFTTLAEAEAAFGKKAAYQAKPATTARTTAVKSNTLTQAGIDAMTQDVKIFTDGACEPNPGEAGTGLALYQHNQVTELWYGLYQAVGTNNTAELKGLQQALLMAKNKLAEGLSVAIYCDSRYAIDCITKWAKGWKSKGWKKSTGEIKNLDIIQPAFELYQELLGQVEICHVNGHVGVEGNELADRMSIIAIEQQTENLCLYQEAYDIKGILALRRG
ncbi:ribonuclease H family protein [Motilimonas pumila]|uniref:Ribonuclease H n=1 Tax=Motilimonas pumila TaxID=2303987 RepID=A0A418YD13_9GAMM|nr:ribonuclease H family protein [Motilimonas pumila]RJG42393.1 ribonuclease HI [Motilimonas pumila]